MTFSRVCHGQNSNSLRSTDFMTISQSAACQNNAYAVFTLTVLNGSIAADLAFVKVSTLAPSGYKIAWMKPIVSSEEDTWDKIGQVSTSIVLDGATTLLSISPAGHLPRILCSQRPQFMKSL